MIGRMFRERARARAIARLEADGVTAAEPGLDRFIQEIADAFAAPIALLTLVEDDLLRVKASIGMEVTCAPRGDSFCTRGIDRDGKVLEVCDATVDTRFRHLPAVTGEPHVRYYIGAPLRLANGVEVGMLCVLDTAARPPASDDQRAYLAGLARRAAALLERNAQLRGVLAA